MTIQVTEQNNQVIVSTTGSQGPVGPTGQQGTSVLNGSSAPQNSDGNNGDFFLETTNSRLYGPKAAGAWPSSYVSLIGPTGSTGSTGSSGSDGQDGKTLLNGSGAPSGGNDGDFWIDTTNNRIYGPKASGSWPSSFTSIVGPQGQVGQTGSTGASGAAASISVGSVATGAEGSSATVSNSGSSSAATFDFSIPKGDKGDKGDTGNFGGATFDYTFDTSTADSDPGTGKVRFNNANISSATSLYIDDTDDGGTDIQSYLRTIDDSTSTIKGHFKVSNKADPNDFALFTISAATEATGYHKVTCAYVSGSTSFSASEDVVLTFARTGDKGDTGATGSAATIAVGSVSTGAAGSSATVSNSGSSGAATLDFTIPRGDTGAQGETGAAASIAVGSVSTGAAGSNTSVSNSGSSSAATFDFTIPRGDTGAAGSAATIAVGTTTTSNPGTNATVSNSGSSSAATFNFTIPRGDTGATGASGQDGKTLLNGSGAPGSGLGNDGDFYIDTTNDDLYGPKANGSWGSATSIVQGPTGPTGATGSAASISLGTVSTGSAGSSVSITNSGSSSAATFNFTIPRGDTGATGPAGQDGVGITAGDKGDVVVSGTGNNTWTIDNNAITNAKILDDTIAESKLDIHAAPSGTNKFLGYTANGMEWAVPPDTNTTYSVQDGELSQNNFTDALKTKLDGIATSANNYSISSDLLDEDNMASNSATQVPSQQSVKAYVDANSSDTTYTAGTGLQLSGTQFSVTSLAITTVQEAANASSQLGLTTQEGDIVVRTDENKTYCRNSGTAGTMADFTLLRTPTDAVTSINSQTGAITANQIAAAVEAASDSNTFTDADHSKLNAIAASANNYSISSDLLDEDDMASNSSSQVASQQSIKAYVDANTGTTNLSYTASSRELASSTGTNVTLPEATTSNAGLQSSSDKSKLDGIASGATNTAAPYYTSAISVGDGGLTQKNFTTTLKTKLDGIEGSADVTDATNVDSAGAVMNSDLDGKGEILIGDGSGDPTALAVGTNDYVLTADSNEATGVKWAAASGGVTSDSYQNTVAGTNAGGSFTSGQAYQNTLFGYDAGADINTGDDNTCIGYQAGKSITDGNTNIFIGREAGETCTTGSANIALGRRAGFGLSSGSYNSIIGYNAGYNITTGERNFAFGDQALYGGTSGVSLTGSDNIAFGNQAGWRVTSGNQNVIFGYSAGNYISSGSHNLCFGQEAGNNITSGSRNVCLGKGSQASSATVNDEITLGDTNISKFRIPGLNFIIKDTTATDNYVLTVDSNGEAGWEAAAGGGGTTWTNGYNLYTSSTSGDGYPDAGNSNAGAANISLGRSCGSSLTSASRDNVLIGKEAAKDVENGQSLVAIGDRAMHAAEGDVKDCIAIGLDSLFILNASSSSSDAEGNVGIGRYSGAGITTGSKNTAVGCEASVAYGGASGITTGSNNTALGYRSGSTGSPSGAIGSSSNVICLGDSNITDLYCNDTSISSSDKRDKTDVTDFTHGLKWVEQLKPVTYRWDKRCWYSDDLSATPDGSKKKTRQHIGFLAQDVLAIEQADGFASKKDDMLVVNLNEDETAYGLKYERLVPVLVNAIKELSEKVKVLEAKLA